MLGAVIATPAMLLFGTALKGHGSGLRRGMAGGSRRQPELSILQPVHPGSSVLHAIPQGPFLMGPPPMQSITRRPAATLLSQGTASSATAATAQPTPGLIAVALGEVAAAGQAVAGTVQKSSLQAGVAGCTPGTSGRSNEPSALPLLLLSPPMSAPAASLLPLQPLGGGQASVERSSPGSVSVVASLEDDADRILQQQSFKPSTQARLTDLFKAAQQAQDKDRDPPEPSPAAKGSTPAGDGAAAAQPPQQQQRSPRTAVELRALLMQLAMRSPEQKEVPTPELGAVSAGEAPEQQQPAVEGAELQQESEVHGSAPSFR